MPMSRDLKEFAECLNSNGVEYLIVGALAVSGHGFPRYTGDIDFPSAPLGITPSGSGRRSCSSDSVNRTFR